MWEAVPKRLLFQQPFERGEGRCRSKPVLLQPEMYGHLSWTDGRWVTGTLSTAAAAADDADLSH
jgi:hypothetical protein